MSRFDTDLLVAGLPALMYRHGQPGIYSPVGAPDIPVTIILGPEETEEEERRGDRILVQRCEGTITVDPDSDFGGVASPDEAAEVTVSGVLWSVEGLAGLTGSYAILKLVRRSSIERALEGYRVR
ncbi:hypothetical protein LCGC14_0605990 [marine sediment metagenome]|uniref:Uncharacterized protein n=1 Tax=marine sediment metagenome TaxID=412755 RepID=A0A0F9RT82_9ZZZZ